MQNTKCIATVSARVQGKVEDSLDMLSERIQRLEKLAEDLVNLVSYSADIPNSLEGVPTNNEPTLYQRINRADSRIDDVNARLALTIDIINQNFGSIKLD